MEGGALTAEPGGVRRIPPPLLDRAAHRLLGLHSGFAASVDRLTMAQTLSAAPITSRLAGACCASRPQGRRIAAPRASRRRWRHLIAIFGIGLAFLATVHRRAPHRSPVYWGFARFVDTRDIGTRVPGGTFIHGGLNHLAFSRGKT